MNWRKSSRRHGGAGGQPLCWAQGFHHPHGKAEIEAVWTIRNLAAGQWRSVFAKLEVNIETGEIGCCAMAGTFGHEARKRALSEKLYAVSCQPAVAAAGSSVVAMATGYSCRLQVKPKGQQVSYPLRILCNIRAERSPFLSASTDV